VPIYYPRHTALRACDSIANITLHQNRGYGGVGGERVVENPGKKKSIVSI